MALKSFSKVPLSPFNRNKLNHEVVQIALNRNTSYANIFHHKGDTYCYKRYASLFFCVGISDDENEMIALMFIHRVVEGTAGSKIETNFIEILFFRFI